MKREAVHDVHPEAVSPPDEAEGDGMGEAYPLLRREIQDIALYEKLRQVWTARRTVLRVALGFLLVAIVYLIGARNEYTSTASLMPEQQSAATPSIGGLDLLQEFGGVLGGLNPGSLMSQQQALPVQIYPDILQSTPILLGLLREEVQIPSLNRTAMLEAFMTEHEPFSLWDAGGEALRDAYRYVTRWARPEQTTVLLPDSTVIQLSDEEMLVVEELRERLAADLDRRTGVLTITATLADPHVAAQVASGAVRSLTEYVTRYRLNRLEQDLAFIQGRHDEAKRRFDDALNELAAFQDRNRNLARNLARTEEQRLQAEYDLAFSVYNSLSTRLEEARIKVQERTPVFQTLQPAAVPLRKSYPMTLLSLCIALVLGVATGTAFVLSDVNLDRIKRTFQR